MPIPEIGEDEDTSIRKPCPFCGVLYSVKGGKVQHETPVCAKWSSPTYLEDARKEEARKAVRTA